MSAPSTNVEKQKRRHKPVLALMAAVAVIVAGLLVVLLPGAEDSPATSPEAAATADQ